MKGHFIQRITLNLPHRVNFGEQESPIGSPEPWESIAMVNTVFQNSKRMKMWKWKVSVGSSFEMNKWCYFGQICMLLYSPDCMVCTVFY